MKEKHISVSNLGSELLLLQKEKLEKNIFCCHSCLRIFEMSSFRLRTTKSWKRFQERSSPSQSLVVAFLAVSWPVRWEEEVSVLLWAVWLQLAP